MESGVWHSVASESREHDPSGHLFFHRVASVRLSHRPEGGVPREKKSVATPQIAPPRGQSSV